MERYGIKRLAKKRAEELANRTEEDIKKEKEAIDYSEDSDVAKIMKIREMDESLPMEERDSAKFRNELREKLRKKEKEFNK